MSYFSNHSTAPRFLANSQPGSTTTTATTTATSANHTLPRRMSSTSKHFSTTLAPGAIERSKSKESLNGTGTVHPLRNTWVVFFHHRPPGGKVTNYEEGINKISSFSSVESFWSLWTHLASPSALSPTTDYLLFHSGIKRPVWEDPLNLTGGKWILRLKKGVADRLWEDIVLAIIGDQFDTPEVPVDDWPEICGCTISVRQNEDIISLWNRVDDLKTRDKIRDTIRKVLNLAPTTIMEYKSNNDSMQDKSSFRNSAVDRTPLS